MLRHTWGDEVLIFNDTTAATHLLNAGVGEILLTLEREDRTLSSLEIWQLTFGGDPDRWDREELLASLDSLRQAGLLVSVEA